MYDTDLIGMLSAYKIWADEFIIFNLKSLNADLTGSIRNLTAELVSNSDITEEHKYLNLF